MLQAVQQPMWLSRIQQDMQSGTYELGPVGFEQLRRDLKLIHDNCMTYQDYSITSLKNSRADSETWRQGAQEWWAFVDDKVGKAQERAQKLIAKRLSVSSDKRQAPEDTGQQQQQQQQEQQQGLPMGSAAVAEDASALPAAQQSKPGPLVGGVDATIDGADATASGTDDLRVSGAKRSAEDELGGGAEQGEGGKSKRPATKKWR